MKSTKMFVLAIVIATVAGCAAVVPAQPVQPAVAMRRLDMAAFGEGRAPITPRVMVRKGHASANVSAPHSDIVFTFKLVNNVRIDGDLNKPGLITRVWVAGVEKPLIHFESQTKIWDQPRIVPWIANGKAINISLPDCMFLDGTPKCEVHIDAQISSWHYDLNRNQVPGYPVRCASIQVSAIGGYGEIVWNDRSSSEITCPEQAQASALGEKKMP